MTKTNLEYYKKELREIFIANCDSPAFIVKRIVDRLDKNMKCGAQTGYMEDILDWMAEPYKEPILDEVEKAYLRSAVKPFRAKVAFIYKCKYRTNECFIRIVVNSAASPSGLDSIYFPTFIGDTMYKGMEENKEYTLKELGL